MTTTAQNTKISTNSPARKSPEKCIVSADPWVKRQKESAKTTKKPNKTKKTKAPGNQARLPHSVQ